MPPALPLPAFDALPGERIPVGIPADETFFFDAFIRRTPDPAFGFAEATLAGLPGRIAVDEMGNNRFPVRASTAPGGLTAAEVETMLTQAVQQAYRTRAAIRQPRGSFAQVNITVVDETAVSWGTLAPRMRRSLGSMCRHKKPVPRRSSVAVVPGKLDHCRL